MKPAEEDVMAEAIYTQWIKEGIGGRKTTAELLRLAIRAAYAQGQNDATAQEKERCARVCEKIGYGDEYWTKSVGAVCAEAIRGGE